ncbi:hypothetical protein OHV05_15640 [Kitasatospora sp. NBC_00070]|uniref:hypothetical protein n=1 Tax=Kitasatospora sp. NBC_00070 TaxID=2975962 RepID=UPI003255156A
MKAFLSAARPLGRVVAGFGLALTLAVGTTALTAGAAHAQSVGSGSLSFNGDPGDYISQGQQHDYSTSAKDRLTVYSNEDRSAVSVSVNGYQGNWWSLDLAAPTGEQLHTGTYTGATRAPFKGAGPGLEISGDGRGCNTLTGSFTVSNLVFGPHGYLQTLDASYEQHCEGGAEALRGEVHITNPVAPAELNLGLGIAVQGTASSLNGKATVHGTVTCNKPVQVAVAGLVTQVKNRVLIRGAYSTSVSCTPGAPVAWSAAADPTGTTPFQRGKVEVTAQATTTDPDYGVNVTASQTTAVDLSKTGK